MGPGTRNEKKNWRKKKEKSLSFKHPFNNMTNALHDRVPVLQCPYDLKSALLDL